jgi:hypothetical protein
MDYFSPRKEQKWNAKILNKPPSQNVPYSIFLILRKDRLFRKEFSYPLE